MYQVTKGTGEITEFNLTDQRGDTKKAFEAREKRV